MPGVIVARIGRTQAMPPALRQRKPATRFANPIALESSRFTPSGVEYFKEGM
jgi:hypothetical protein